MLRFSFDDLHWCYILLRIYHEWSWAFQIALWWLSLKNIFKILSCLRIKRLLRINDWFVFLESYTLLTKEDFIFLKNSLSKQINFLINWRSLIVLWKLSVVSLLLQIPWFDIDLLFTKGILSWSWTFSDEISFKTLLFKRRIIFISSRRWASSFVWLDALNFNVKNFTHSILKFLVKWNTQNKLRNKIFNTLISQCKVVLHLN